MLTIIIKALDEPWKIVKKFLKSANILCRAGHHPKIDGKNRRKLVSNAAKRPTVPLEELQQFLACFYSLLPKHDDNLPNSLCLGYRVQWLDKNWQKDFLKMYIQSPRAIWNNVLWSKLNCLAILPESMQKKKTPTSPAEHIPLCEAWGWKHHALGLLFFSWDRGFNQGRGDNEQLQIPVNTGVKPQGIC